MTERNGSGPTNGRREGGSSFSGVAFSPLFLLTVGFSGTARSRQGRAISAAEKEFFVLFKKLFRSAPLTGRTVLEDGRRGKAGPGVSGGVPLAGSGAAPRSLPRVFCAASRIGQSLKLIRQVLRQQLAPLWDADATAVLGRRRT